MNNFDWAKELASAVTVCDKDGIIVYMNDKSVRQFESDGGAALLGKNLYDCHPPAASEKISQMIQSGSSNTYTIEKNGLKKIIRQEPWFEDGRVMGMVEFSFVLPADMPHFVRK